MELAKEADREPEPEEVKPKRKRKKKEEPEPAELAPAPVLIVADPEFEAMINWGVGMVTDIAKTKLDWSDPGVHWRTKVSVMISRLIQRIQPMSESWVTDLITIGGYTALWVLPNVANTPARNGKNTSLVRDDGKRENVQDAGTH